MLNFLNGGAIDSLKPSKAHLVAMCCATNGIAETNIVYIIWFIIILINAFSDRPISEK